MQFWHFDCKTQESNNNLDVKLAPDNSSGIYRSNIWNYFPLLMDLLRLYVPAKPVTMYVGFTGIHLWIKSTCWTNSIIHIIASFQTERHARSTLILIVNEERNCHTSLHDPPRSIIGIGAGNLVAELAFGIIPLVRRYPTPTIASTFHGRDSVGRWRCSRRRCWFGGFCCYRRFGSYARFGCCAWRGAHAIPASCVPTAF